MIPARSRLLPLASAAVMIGLAVTGADRYFGNGNGKTGAFILGALILGGLVFEFLAATHSIRYPRALDADFVCGADYARRRAAAMLSLRSALLRQIWIPLAALAIMGWALPMSAVKMAGTAAALCAESFAVSLAMIASVRFGWIPASRKKFFVREVRASDAFGAATASLLIRNSDAIARALTGWIPGPDRWILRRKLLYLFRTDPIYLAVHLILTVVLAVQFNITWGFNLGAVFTLVNLLLSLTLLQIAFRDPDGHYAACAHFLPPRRVDHRATLFLFLSVAGVLLAQFALGCALHMGARGALTSRAFWHVLVTGAAFPFLLAVELPWRRGTSGREWDMNSRVILNFCYLGLAGWLFMFSWPGVAATGAVLAVSAWFCGRSMFERKVV